MAGTAVADPVAALGGVCAAVRPGGPADAVFGMVPAAVASPATVAEASELLRAAAGHGLAILPRGTGTKLTWGAPPDRCDLVVETTRLDRVIEHAAGDLVVRVQAGLTMARLAAELAAAGQQLALDVPRAGHRTRRRAGTVGGVIATGAAGPRRLRYGAPRDLLIGITVVLADGTVASSGGKVVKNVAGYDIGKLFAGSHGTLGLITEAAFRLHPLPQATAYVTVSCPTAADALEAVRAAIESQLGPSAAEIDRPAPGLPVSVCLLFEGTADAIAERVTRMRDILGDGRAGGRGTARVVGPECRSRRRHRAADRVRARCAPVRPRRRRRDRGHAEPRHPPARDPRLGGRGRTQGRPHRADVTRCGGIVRGGGSPPPRRASGLG